MATTVSDVHTVKVQVSIAELQSLLSDKAIELGFIDFNPDRMQLYQNGNDGQGNPVYEIIFEADV